MFSQNMSSHAPNTFNLSSRAQHTMFDCRIIGWLGEDLTPLYQLVACDLNSFVPMPRGLVHQDPIVHPHPRRFPHHQASMVWAHWQSLASMSVKCTSLFDCTLIMAWIKGASESNLFPTLILSGTSLTMKGNNKFWIFSVSKRNHAQQTQSTIDSRNDREMRDERPPLNPLKRGGCRRHVKSGAQTYLNWDRALCSLSIEGGSGSGAGATRH